MVEKIADKVTEFSGTLAFLLINAGWFFGWIVMNTIAPRLWHVDPYPFQFLTMAVSLEAISLSIFVLISQNRQAARDRQTTQHDLQVNIESKQQLSEMKQQIDHIEQMLKAVCE